MNMNSKKLKTQELGNVVGGTCYADDAYSTLNIEPATEYGQHPDDRPVITTVGNSCKLSDTTCRNCKYGAPNGLFYACRARSKRYDPAN